MENLSPDGLVEEAKGVFTPDRRLSGDIISIAVEVCPILSDYFINCIHLYVY